MRKKFFTRSLSILAACALLGLLCGGCETSGERKIKSSAYAMGRLEAVLNYSMDQTALAVLKAMRSLGYEKIRAGTDTFKGEYVYRMPESGRVTVNIERTGARECRIAIHSGPDGGRNLARKIMREVEAWL